MYYEREHTFAAGTPARMDTIALPTGVRRIVLVADVASAQTSVSTAPARVRLFDPDGEDVLECGAGDPCEVEVPFPERGDWTIQYDGDEETTAEATLAVLLDPGTPIPARMGVYSRTLDSGDAATETMEESFVVLPGYRRLEVVASSEIGFLPVGSTARVEFLAPDGKEEGTCDFGAETNQCGIDIRIADPGTWTVRYTLTGVESVSVSVTAKE